MDSRFLQSFVLLALMYSSSVHAQTSFSEIEPNSGKAEATFVIGMTAGDTITGVSTGTSTLGGSTLSTTSDYFHVGTAALPLGIYRHRLTLETATVIPNHVFHQGSLRGLNQDGIPGVGGVLGTVSDGALQEDFSNSATAHVVQWYGFGKAEELYYRVQGSAVTTPAYTVTLTTAPVTATVIPYALNSSSPITITTVGQTTSDTHIMLYDANLNPVPGAMNDEEFNSPNFNVSKLTRVLSPGIYYVAIGSFMSSDQLSPPDDDSPQGGLTDFPNCLVVTSVAEYPGFHDYDFMILASNGVVNVSSSVPTLALYEANWHRITVAAGAPNFPPVNDSCSSAWPVEPNGRNTGRLVFAGNESTPTCDPVPGSQDVWYAYTNISPSVTKVLSADTCSSQFNTVLSAHAACGGPELQCNDDCASGPCGGTASCISGIQVVPGGIVYLRVGALGSGGGDFELHVSTFGLPIANDNCAAPIVLSGPGTYGIDNSSATTGTEGQNETLCNALAGKAIKKDVWFSYVPHSSGTVTVSTCGGLPWDPTMTTAQDSKIAVYPGTGCPVPGTAIGCADESGVCTICPCFSFNATTSFTAVCGSTYTIQIGSGANSSTSISGTFSITESGGTSCATTATPFCLGDGTGSSCPCANPGAPGNGCASGSFPVGGQLTSSGFASTSSGSDSLLLTASNLPGPGLFFQANGLVSTPLAWGDGLLCATFGLVRLGVDFPTSGVATLPNASALTPIHIAGAPISAGDTKYYQCWYRTTPGLCGANNFSLTQGLSLSWSP